VIYGGITIRWSGDVARFGFEWHFDLIGSAGKSLRG